MSLTTARIAFRAIAEAVMDGPIATARRSVVREIRQSLWRGAERVSPPTRVTAMIRHQFSGGLVTPGGAV